jgi:hypothetical protein
LLFLCPIGGVLLFGGRSPYSIPSFFS